MIIRRTANAGVLLTLDGVSFLLDGVCQEVKPYLATPKREREGLLQSCPQILAFTHTHKDHCDPAFAAAWQRQMGRVILCPGGLEGCRTTGEPMSIGGVSVIPVESRHIGKAEPGLAHFSYILKGSKCVWFLGDAAPTQWRSREDIPRPDVVIAPYAYATTPSAWSLTQKLGAEKVVLLHLPAYGDDPFGLWDAVKICADEEIGGKIQIPQMGETLEL